MAAQRVLIADGHHRYRTSLAPRRHGPPTAEAGPWDDSLFLVDADLHGPAVLAIRLLAGVGGPTVLAEAGG